MACSANTFVQAPGPCKKRRTGVEESRYRKVYILPTLFYYISEEAGEPVTGAQGGIFQSGDSALTVRQTR